MRAGSFRAGPGDCDSRRVETCRHRGHVPKLVEDPLASPVPLEGKASPLNADPVRSASLPAHVHAGPRSDGSFHLSSIAIPLFNEPAFPHSSGGPHASAQHSVPSRGSVTSAPAAHSTRTGFVRGVVMPVASPLVRPRTPRRFDGQSHPCSMRTAKAPRALASARFSGAGANEPGQTMRPSSAASRGVRQLVLARKRGESVQGIQMKAARPAAPFGPHLARWAVNRGCDGASGFSVVRDPRFT